jgi:hypothetical protein
VAIVLLGRARYFPRPFVFQTSGKVRLMRADIEAMAADIEQSVGLLRRRL